MKELDGILEKLFSQGYDHGLVDGRGLIGETEGVKQARTAILKLIKSKLLPEPNSWTNMSKRLRNYNEGK